MDDFGKAEQVLFNFMDLSGELKNDKFEIEDLLFVIRNADLMEYVVNAISNDTADDPKVRANAPKVGRPSHAEPQVAVDPEAGRVARLADEAGLSETTGYRKLQEWGRTQNIRKGSDFWRTVSRVRSARTGVHRAHEPGAPGAGKNVVHLSERRSK